MTEPFGIDSLLRLGKIKESLDDQDRCLLGNPKLYGSPTGYITDPEMLSRQL